MFLDKFIDVKMTMVKIVVMTIFIVKMTMRRQ
ncbi:hypothetical protein SB6422_04520 [Klebsiella huaxiensis]|uniref:Uncharacterized protein n=1 Tax=Klebsiella huaxiensis TaxID=2153354 RepID=A0A564HUV5_9ENTR|nr:hypothetical protein SB6422_04520 [Klebsiella huaxiensis]